MHAVQNAVRDQTGAAAERFATRAAERHKNIRAVQQPGGLANADSPERIKKRVERLSRYYTDVDLARAALDPTPAHAGIALEKVIGTPDLVDIRYLEVGTIAARAVCRVDIRDDRGQTQGYGTGSLVSPRLVLTNHHVLSDPASARSSRLEFNVQDGVDGQPLQPKVFSLDPDAFFVADEERDFALVAVADGNGDLSGFGFNPLIAAEGKAVIGEYVTIVQHPGGRPKQVALRENRVVDLVGSFIHYEADTEPGSSGSPVFNKQWEMVGLHHASVPAEDHEELGGFMNEGIRVSRILKFVGAQDLTGSQQDLASQLAGRERVVGGRTAQANGGAPTAIQTHPPSEPAVAAEPQAAGAVRVTVPLELTVQLGSARVIGAVAVTTAGAAVDASEEAITIDPDYSNRKGFDTHFIGTGKLEVPLPKLARRLARKASAALPYHHFSVVMNRDRRLAFFTAVNIDGKLGRRLKRETDRWSLDPRLLAGEQVGEDVYANNPLDRGHLVRRLDPAWGRTQAEAKRANDDTYHFTNCTPQHEDFNQNKTTWAGLEDYVLNNAQNARFKASVFSGPVFATDDDEYRDVMLPRQFWKVAVMAKKSGELSATGYLLSQERLIEGLEADTDFSYGAYKTFQVPVRQVESLTGLGFGDLLDHDPLERVEAMAGPRTISSPDDLVL